MRTITATRTVERANPGAGALGGVGPAGTIDFYMKLFEVTSAAHDQDYIPVIVTGDLRVADRLEAIENGTVGSPLLAPMSEPDILTDYLEIGLEKVRAFALKSRVHSRWGFCDSRPANYAIIVEPERPFRGTTRLDALRYAHLRSDDYYPYGCNDFRPKLIGGDRAYSDSVHAR